MWAAIAFKMSEELLEKIFDLYVIEVESVKHVKDVIPALLVQPINRDEIAIFKKNGGNCLGLEDVDGPLIRKWTFLCLIHPQAKCSVPSIQYCFSLVKYRGRQSDERDGENHYRLYCRYGERDGLTP